MKKMIFVLPSLALLLSACSFPGSQTPSSTPSMTETSQVTDFTGAFTTFLGQINARNSAMNISPLFGIYGKYNPGAMARVQHFATFSGFLAAYANTSFGAARSGTGDVFTCDSYHATLVNPVQKCNCAVDIPAPQTHKCQIGTITGTNTLISEPLTRDLSEVNTIPLSTGAALQISEAQNAEANIIHRVYIEDRSAVLYFIPNGTGYSLLMMDITDCCSA